MNVVPNTTSLMEDDSSEFLFMRVTAKGTVKGVADLLWKAADELMVGVLECRGAGAVAVAFMGIIKAVHDVSKMMGCMRIVVSPFIKETKGKKRFLILRCEWVYRADYDHVDDYDSILISEPPENSVRDLMEMFEWEDDDQ